MKNNLRGVKYYPKKKKKNGLVFWRALLLGMLFLRALTISVTRAALVYNDPPPENECV